MPSEIVASQFDAFFYKNNKGDALSHRES